MTVRIDQLPGRGIHAVGAAGLETATMVRYLVEHGHRDIVLHDVAVDVDAAFTSAHRFQSTDHVERSRRALRQCADVRNGPGYLDGIEEATVIVAPVSWFLHVERDRLAPLRDRFVLYPDACFDLFAGRIVAITGSYGKTTTSRFAATLLDGHLCGNDREFTFDLDQLAAAAATDHLVFEASNRHLANGFRRRVDVGLVTGITLNHEPDHGSFEEYRATKYSMADRCHDLLYHQSIPQRFDDAGRLVASGSSFGPEGAWSLAGSTVVGPGGTGCALPGAEQLTALNREDALGAAASALLLGAAPADVERRSAGLAATRPRYRQSVVRRDGRTVINDAAACMPAATAALVATLDEPFVLICGGDRQRYRPGEFDALAGELAANRFASHVVTTGPMAGPIEDALTALGFDRVTRAEDVGDAVGRAFGLEDLAVVFSPGCGTGTLFVDKYARGEEFDDAVDRLVRAGEAVH